tara:strand:+ start:70 stop:357 length:288 start_codon:yes stop_codon:yes gene_type:complete
MEATNKLIAEFMNLPKQIFKPSGIMNYGIKDNWYELHELSYHLSWDWLMPVVRECFENGAEGNEIGDITHGLLDFNIEATYDAVVVFIKSLKNRY